MECKRNLLWFNQWERSSKGTWLLQRSFIWNWISKWKKEWESDDEKDDINCEEKDEKNDEKIVVEKEGITPDGKGVDIIVKKINLMKIPDDSDKGFVLNIKYKKNGKIYVDNFDTSKENVPSDKLVKYYESFIRKNFKGIVYEDEMSFE